MNDPVYCTKYPGLFDISCTRRTAFVFWQKEDTTERAAFFKYRKPGDVEWLGEYHIRPFSREDFASHEFDRLKPGTQYEFTLYTRTTKGKTMTYFEKDCMCTTQADIPDPVTNIREYFNKKDLYTVYWEHSENNGAEVSHYQVWSTYPNSTEFNSTYNIMTTPNKQINYPLNKNLPTQVHISAVNRVGQSSDASKLIHPIHFNNNATESAFDLNPIIYGILGGILLLILLLIICLCCKYQRSRKKEVKAHMVMMGTLTSASRSTPTGTPFGPGFTEVDSKDTSALSNGWNHEFSSLYGGGTVSPPPDPFDPDDNFGAVPCVPATNVRFLRYLGSGAFGKAWEGWVKWVIGPDEKRYQRVALKVRNPTALSEDEFKREALLMFKYNHTNLVKLIGVCMDPSGNQLQCLILEMMEQGNLRDYLHKARPHLSAAHLRRAARMARLANGVSHGSSLTMSPSNTMNTTVTSKLSTSGTIDQQPGFTVEANMYIFEASLDIPDLITILLDVARACQYLDEKHYVHRDIAARNCLVSHRHPSGRIVKLSDFGLARDVYRNDYYRKQNEPKLPVRWMSPEAIQNGLFTSKSDVWAFAVTSWEVMTLGMDPFYGHRNRGVINLILGGHVLEKPENCPNELFDQLLLCWSRFPDMRPTFAELVKKLEEFVEMSKSPESALSKPFIRKVRQDALQSYGIAGSPGYDNNAISSPTTEQTLLTTATNSGRSTINNNANNKAVFMDSNSNATSISPPVPMRPNRIQHRYRTATDNSTLSSLPSRNLMTTSTEFDALPQHPDDASQNRTPTNRGDRNHILGLDNASSPTTGNKMSASFSGGRYRVTSADSSLFGGDMTPLIMSKSAAPATFSRQSTQFGNQERWSHIGANTTKENDETANLLQTSQASHTPLYLEIQQPSSSYYTDGSSTEDVMAMSSPAVIMRSNNYVENKNNLTDKKMRTTSQIQRK